MTVELIHGDVLEVLLSLPDDSVDALLTDPPGARKFMGLEWDSDKGGFWEWVEWMREVMAQCLRVMKPGSHGMVWALPKTSHWTGMATELAGFEVRDVIDHIFPKGMPKGGYLDVPEGSQWDGWGYNLKPTKEFWFLIQKPICSDSILKNVMTHGVGALNIRAGKVAHDEDCKWMKPQSVNSLNNPKLQQAGRRKDTLELKPDGRWPTHVFFTHGPACQKLTDVVGGWICSDGCPVSQLSKQAGDKDVAKIFHQLEYEPFFLASKPSSGEKSRPGIDANEHPTVKPVGLMREFARLITPHGGVILDPFNGSGTTGVAAVMDGFSYIGIDRELQYLDLTERRLSWRQLSLL